MPVRPRALACLALIATLAGCGQKDAPPPAAVAAPTPAAAPVATATTPASTAPAPATPSDFDPASIAESTATLPPFPFFQAPEGLASVLADADKNVSFDRTHLIAGNKVIAVEGKIFHDTFPLESPEGRKYSEIEVQANYSGAITPQDAHKNSTPQHTCAVPES